MGVRAGAARALGRLRAPVGPLLDALSDPAPAVRFAVVDGLAERTDPAAVDALVEAAVRLDGAEDEPAAALALASLERIAAAGGSDVAKAMSLVVLFVDGGLANVEAVTGLIHRVAGDDGLQPLTEAITGFLSSPDEAVRRRAVALLERIGDPAVSPVLKVLDDPEAVLHAVEVLGAIRDARATEALVGLLRSDRAEVRRAAALALGRIQDARAAQGLLAATVDAEHPVREAAIEALSALGPVATIVAMSGVLGGSGNGVPELPWWQGAALSGRPAEPGPPAARRAAGGRGRTGSSRRATARRRRHRRHRRRAGARCPGDLARLRRRPGPHADGREPDRQTQEPALVAGGPSSSGGIRAAVTRRHEAGRASMGITLRGTRYILTGGAVALAAAVGTATAPAADTHLCFGKVATIDFAGDNGNRTIVGTPGDDVIYAGNGKDTIDGGGGNDAICGLGGDDTIRGGVGNDEIFGSQGDDSLGGQAGDDEVIGGPGNDQVNGGFGFDVVRGGDGNDILNGGGDDDQVFGGADDDVLAGNDGDADSCNGGPGTDRVTANGGCETIIDDAVLISDDTPALTAAADRKVVAAAESDGGTWIDGASGSKANAAELMPAADANSGGDVLGGNVTAFGDR